MYLVLADGDEDDGGEYAWRAASVNNRHTSSGSMQSLIDKYSCFKNHSYTLEAVDVTLKQNKRPSSNIHESKVHFSGKQTLFGYKVEVFVWPTGIATAFR